MDYYDLIKLDKPREVVLGKRIGEKTRERALEMIDRAVAKTGYSRIEKYEDIQWYRLESVPADDNPLIRTTQIKIPIDANQRWEFDTTTYDYVMKERTITHPQWSKNTTDDVFGGLALVNGRGKIAKRIRSNLYKNYQIKLPAQDIAEIGAYINNRATAMGVWHYQLSRDLERYVGRFGDSGSCFQPGGQHSAHREAMECDENTAIALIFDDQMRNYARAWVHYVDYERALVFFNAYSERWLGQLRTRQIASIIGSDLGLETRRVEYSTDIYQNNGWAIAIGGNKDRKYYDFYFNPEDGYYCTHCDELVSEDNITFVFDNPVCDYCLSEYYFYCEDCYQYESNDYGYWLEVEERYVCESCYKDDYFECSSCGDSFSKAQEMRFPDDSESYCEECYMEAAVECTECGVDFHRDDVIMEDDNAYCDDCFDELLEKRTED